jgi:hypothetical protein
MRFLPEYGPARKLALAYVDEFFNKRCQSGRAHAQIIQACARAGVAVDMHLEPGELEAFRAAAGADVLALPNLTLDFHSPGRAILQEGAPIFVDADGQRLGLVFHNPRLMEEDARVYDFARWLCERSGFTPFALDFPFATAQMMVNEDVALLCAEQFEHPEDRRKLDFFQAHFPGYQFHIVPPLAGDTTADLDMYLWPIAPRVWIASQYPDGSPQEQSIAPALAVLARAGHTVHRVPGLEPIVYDDVNTMPNYANGVILNGTALVPAYGREEDRVVVDILRGCGYAVDQIDCTRIIESNAAIHCISCVGPA